ncbi:hypothetical protein B1813_12470 [Saccharomonospora piscinae]|uniref:Uncharacterized protein n=1 Tax=Saccharomonospora piscinae TaxID=687388 RepID=A0A1V9A715_SACPI|nr:hypothetical protein [Saccharomonospora piscinae]OQO92927.1 hypothetical protein B1813_12470 [Saccharomonospora piscinae]TLW93065.1 hypothetical protein FFT09_06420 [Saccharomonospora piscinae]
MAVRLDVEPLKNQQPEPEAEFDTPAPPRRARLNLNFVKLSHRTRATSLLHLDDPLTLRYLSRA